MNRIINRMLIPLAAMLLLGVGLVIALSERPWAPRENLAQPFPFSHRIHAGVNKIPCQYCHEYARRSTSSGVPPIERCVGCHGDALVGGIKAVTAPLMSKQHQMFEIRWNRVYMLPDFVKFRHQPHIHAGIACQTCHGDVQDMDKVVPVHEINMGFCITCHSQRGVSVDCVLCHH